MTSTDSPGDDPEFGPSGYLPQRAAKRARKIVLRAPMGIHWVWGAVVLGVGIVLVGLLFLATAGGPPGAPFVERGPTSSISEGHGQGNEYVSTRSGRLRIFHVQDPSIAWCEASRQFEGETGIWSATGRGLGVASLEEHPTVIVDDILYWDPTALQAGPLPDSIPGIRGC